MYEEGKLACLVMRPGAPSANPFHNLAASLLHPRRDTRTGLAASLDEDAVAGLAPTLRDGPTVLADSLSRLAGDGSDARNLLLIVDQFEELFTLVTDPRPDADDGVRGCFVQCLRAAVDTSHTRDPAARCIMTLRADYTGRALGIRGLADLLRDSDIKLAPMTPAELRASIEEPSGMLGVRFEHGLVDELMQSVGGSPDALPLLKFTLAELWSQQRNRTILRSEVPPDIRSAEVLVAPLVRHAKAVFQDLSRRFGEAAELLRGLFRNDPIKALSFSEQNPNPQPGARVPSA